MMNQSKIRFFTQLMLLLFFFGAYNSVVAQDKENHFTKYHSPSELNDILSSLSENHSDISKIHQLAVSPGKNEVNMIEIGPEINAGVKQLPAILVVANMGGSVPISSEAALYLIKLVLEK